MTPTVRDTFKKEMCNKCPARLKCGMTIFKQAACATLSMWCDRQK